MLSAKAPRERRVAVIDLRPLALLAALAALLAVGCGDEDEGTEPGPDTGGAGETTLTVTLDADGSGEQDASTEQVSCAEGDEGDPACAALADVTAVDLGPVPPDVACTEIYGGPDEVRVSGTLHGERVDETLTRANGCEIDRFDALIPLLDGFPDYTPGQALQGGY